MKIDRENRLQRIRAIASALGVSIDDRRTEELLALLHAAPGLLGSARRALRLLESGQVTAARRTLRDALKDFER